MLPGETSHPLEMLIAKEAGTVTRVRFLVGSVALVTGSLQAVRCSLLEGDSLPSVDSMAHRPDLVRGMDPTNSRGSRNSRNTDSRSRDSRGVHPHNSSKGRTTTKPGQRCLRQTQRRNDHGESGDARLGHESKGDLHRG